MAALGGSACGADDKLFSHGPSGTGGTTASSTSGTGGDGGATSSTSGTGGIGACDGVDQPSVTIVITNHLSEDRYIEWTSTPSGLGHIDALRYERQEGSGWEPVAFARPNTDCEAYCSASNEGSDSCCKWCGGQPHSMQVVPPGQSVQRGWAGKRYVADGSWCDCPCNWQCLPQAGHYRVLVDVAATITCGSNPCEEPNDYGKIEGASPTGEPTPYTAEFDVLFTSSELHVAIE